MIGYTLERKLATGGMAEIFLARRSADNRQVVVKMMLPALAHDPSFVSAFLNEGELASRLTHPHIAEIYQFGAQGNAYFIAMEYVPGIELRALLARAQAPLPLPVAMQIFADLTAALDYAHGARDAQGHALGIVHRDVTPANILILPSGITKLVDFGIAKAVANHRLKTLTGDVKGTMSYVSPEQLQGLPIDQRVDVFACGIVLYEMLTLHHPFRGDNDFATMQNILDANPTPCRSMRPEIPEALAEVVTHALAFDPEDRYDSCADLQAAVEAALPGVTRSHAQVAKYLAPKRKRTWWPLAVVAAATVAGVLLRPRSPVVVPAPRPVVVAPPVPLAPAIPAVAPLPPPRHAVAEVKRAPGRLRLVIHPWATVTIDNKPMGDTPIAVQTLAPGVHQVHITNSELGRTLDTSARIISGEETVLRENLLHD